MCTFTRSSACPLTSSAFFPNHYTEAKLCRPLWIEIQTHCTKCVPSATIASSETFLRSAACFLTLLHRSSQIIALSAACPTFSMHRPNSLHGAQLALYSQFTVSSIALSVPSAFNIPTQTFERSAAYSLNSMYHPKALREASTLSSQCVHLHGAQRAF